MKLFKYLLLISMVLWSSSLVAQSFKLSDLKAKTWQVESGLEGLEFLDVYFSFQNTKHTITIIAKDGSEEDLDCLFDMYISDSKQESFDYSKIGKSQSGKYIVCHNTYELLGETYENFNCYEIVTLTADKLALKELDNTLTFKAR